MKNTELCECGCGNPAPIATRNIKRLGIVKGGFRKYIHGHNGRGKGKPQIKGPLHRVDPSTGCWLWLYYKDNKGYGIKRHNGALVKAERKRYSSYKKSSQ